MKILAERKTLRVKSVKVVKRDALGSQCSGGLLSLAGHYLWKV